MWKKIVGGFVVIIVVISGLMLWKTSVSEELDEFLVHVQAKQYDNAYTMLHKSFKSSTPPEKFKQFLTESKLVNYKEANWGNYSFDGNTGKLQGSLVTHSGDIVPLTFSFINTESGWKIYSIHETFKSIAHTSIMIFAKSLNEKSMTKLHSHIAASRSSLISVQDLDEAYQAFYDAKVDLMPLKASKPIFDTKPKISEKNRVTLTGHYPTTPSKVFFENNYIKEGGEWRLVELQVTIK